MKVMTLNLIKKKKMTQTTCEACAMRLVFFFIGFYSLSLSLSLHCLCFDMVCGSDLVFTGLIWFVGLGGGGSWV